MLTKQLKELLAFAQKTDLTEVLWEKKDTIISFSRTPVQKHAAKLAAGAPAAKGSTSTPAPAPDKPIIRSTMVGTFFRSDSPDRPPFVVEGTRVTSGQPVAAIEAMKIMKDVLSPGTCRIVKALVANGQPVEYGQPLFEIEPGVEEEAGV